jgi:hypothetical protein
MTEQRFYSPLKIGLLTVTVAYFLFNLHTMFTLEWIGEWDRIAGGTFGLTILIEDVNATIGVVFRFAGSVIAFAALIYYFARKRFSVNRSYLVLKVVLVFEAIYWLGLLASGIAGVLSLFDSSGFIGPSSLFYFYYVTGSVLPGILESTIIPIVLLILAYKLSPLKPIKGAIKWSLISGTIIVLVYWLLNTGIWLFVIPVKGIEYLTSYPYMMVAFLSTLIGLLALTIYSAYATKKLAGTENLHDLNLKPVGVIILGLGLFYLWNYLTWIFFGGDHVWSSWFAWLLGHNMDLWMLSLPLVGLPLLFSSKKVTAFLLNLEGTGAAFAGIFLAAYLGGLPSTNVLHSEPIFRIPLAIFGAALLVLVFSALILAALAKKD